MEIKKDIKKTSIQETDSGKKDIRKRFLAVRRAIPPEVQSEKSRRICEKVIRHPYFQEADVLFCYMDFRGEVQTALLLETAGKLRKRCALPKVTGETMEFYLAQTPDDLERGAYGILEPVPERCVRADAAQPLMVVPGVAFDPLCFRMGYGGGFYDRYLCAHPGIRTVGIGYEEQMASRLPVEDTDVRLDFVITDKNIYTADGK